MPSFGSCAAKMQKIEWMKWIEIIALVKNGASWEKPAPDKPSINESHPLRNQTVIKGNKKEVMLSECHGWNLD